MKFKFRIENRKKENENEKAMQMWTTTTMMMKKRHTQTTRALFKLMFHFFFFYMTTTYTVTDNLKWKKRNIFILGFLILMAAYSIVLLLCEYYFFLSVLRASNRVVNQHFGRLMCCLSGVFCLVPSLFRYVCSLNKRNCLSSFHLFCSLYQSFVQILSLLFFSSSSLLVFIFMYLVNFISLNVQFVRRFVARYKCSHMVYKQQTSADALTEKGRNKASKRENVD